MKRILRPLHRVRTESIFVNKEWTHDEVLRTIDPKDRYKYDARYDESYRDDLWDREAESKAINKSKQPFIFRLFGLG